MGKQKTGLHKEISAIFNGVPLPNNSGRENPSAAATIESGSGDIPPHPASAPQKPEVQPEQRRAEETLRPKSKVELISNNNKNALFDMFRPYLENFKAKVLTPPAGVSPAKHMATILMVPVLMIVVILVFGRQFLKRSPNTNEAKLTEKTVNIAANIRSEIEWSMPAPFPVGLRDPMQRTAAGGNAAAEDVVNAETFFIKGIVYSEDNPSALIDTKIVYQGDVYKGAKIIKINIDSVEFEINGNTWTQKIQR